MVLVGSISQLKWRGSLKACCRSRQWHKLITRSYSHSNKLMARRSKYVYMLLPICTQFRYANGTPVCKYFSDPRPYAYGDPHMRTGIPRCIVFHTGIQDLISHMETISLCIRLVTEIFTYAYMHLPNPHVHTGISVMRSPYAYGDHQDPCMHTGIQLNFRTHMVIGVMWSMYAYRDLQDPRMRMGI